MITASTDASEILPSWDLEDVFIHFLVKLQALPTPRSVAEARIEAPEFEGLARWFCKNWQMARLWCESTWQDDLSGGISASRQEMIGALLLMLASEACRDKSNEIAVWPIVTQILKANKGAYSAFFVAGQPTTACKKAIAAGAHRLHLRNLIDRYGAQEYFDTVKLQFGFTFRGAVRRLPEWLDRLGVPIAVKVLSGDEPEYADLESTSFSRTWKALQDFRRNRVSEEYATAILNSSPWIRPQWTAELLRAARLRPSRAFSGLITAEAPDRSSDPLCAPALKWDSPLKPQLVLRLNDERVFEILDGSDMAVFEVDGRVVDRWTAQEGGGWRGRRELPCQPESAKANLRPKLLSISSRGKLLDEEDLSEIGLGEPLVIFDLTSGAQVDPGSRLDPSTDYGIICDTDIGIKDASQSLKLKECSVYRLAAPWARDVKVVCDGILYWKPKVDESEPLPPIRLTLDSVTGEACEIESASDIRVSGVPEGATAVSLITGASSHSVAPNGAFWQTEHPVRVTLGMALGQDRLRVRVTGIGYTRTVIPKLAVGLRGIACIQADPDADAEPRWELLNRSRPLNRADGTGRARIFVEKSSAQLYEGPRRVGKISSHALPLKDMVGWGAPLIVRSEGQSDLVLVDSVEDYGRGRFLPPLFKGLTAASFFWRTPMPPGGEHRVFLWPDITQPPKRLDAHCIATQRDDLVWTLPNLGSVAAMAIAYQGARIASYWSTEPMIGALRRLPSSRLFGLFRWLKVPVLNPSFRAPMQEAVALVPADFVSGWSGVESVLSGLVHEPAEQGIDSVIREFLWNYREKNEGKIERIARAFPRPWDGAPQSDSEAFKASLVRLGEVCPSLAYNLARQKLRGDKYRKYVRAVVAAMLRLPGTTESPQLRHQLVAVCRDCANLVCISPETLEASMQSFEAHLENRVSHNTRVEPDLRRLGETSRGRQFLTAWLLLRLVERAGF